MASQSSVNEQHVCSICLGGDYATAADIKALVFLQCGHVVHSDCWAQHVRTHTGSLTCIMRCVGKPVATALDLKDESVPRVAAAVQGGGWDKATTCKELLLYHCLVLQQALANQWAWRATQEEAFASLRRRKQRVKSQLCQAAKALEPLHKVLHKHNATIAAVKREHATVLRNVRAVRREVKSCEAAIAALGPGVLAAAEELKHTNSKPDSVVSVYQKFRHRDNPIQALSLMFSARAAKVNSLNSVLSHEAPLVRQLAAKKKKIQTELRTVQRKAELVLRQSLVATTLVGHLKRLCTSMGLSADVTTAGGATTTQQHRTHGQRHDRHSSRGHRHSSASSSHSSSKSKSRPRRSRSAQPPPPPPPRPPPAGSATSLPTALESRAKSYGLSKQVHRGSRAGGSSDVAASPFNPDLPALELESLDAAALAMEQRRKGMVHAANLRFVDGKASARSGRFLKLAARAKQNRVR